MSSSIARIQVNGIEVGSLPIETYNGIVSSARQDRRLYLAYALAALGLILRMLTRSTIAVPGFLMLAFTFFLIVEPSSITGLITSLRASTPEEITSTLIVTVMTTWTFAVILVPAALMLFCPEQISFNNPFTDSVNRRVRSMLEVPTEGRVLVEIVEASTSAE